MTSHFGVLDDDVGEDGHDRVRPLVSSKPRATPGLSWLRSHLQLRVLNTTVKSGGKMSSGGSKEGGAYLNNVSCEVFETSTI